MADVLFIHPYGHPIGYVVPVGLIGLMNTLTCSKIAKLSYELDDKSLEVAKIIVMDIHWYMSLAGVESIMPRIRSVFSGPVIVGGYTATILAEQIVNNLDIDYVIKGDSEYSFKRLIECLLTGCNDIRDIPNLVTRHWATSQSYTISENEYSSIDYITLDWFPLHQEWVAGLAKEAKENRGDYVFTWSPLIPVFRGCLHNCEYCYGSPDLQKKIFGRGIVARSAESVVKDLVTYSVDDDIPQVYFVNDFVDILGEDYTRTVCCNEYNVDLVYDFYNYPSCESLDMLLQSFNYCCFLFSISMDHNTNSCDGNLEHLLRLINSVEHRDDCSIVLFYNSEYPEQIELLCELEKKYAHMTSLKVMDNRKWYIPVPYPSESQETQDEEFVMWMNEARLNNSILRARRLMRNGRLYAAQEELDKARQITPTSETQQEFLYFQLGIVNFKIRSFDEAVVHFEKSLTHSKSPAGALYYLSKCFEQLGNPDKEKELISQARKRDPFLDAELIETNGF
jgi:tetratricopeptide (TPR) repeat protein